MKQRITIFINKDAVKALKVMAAEHEQNLSEYIEQFVVEEYEEFNALKKNKNISL